MATHSSVLAWRIPGTGEPGGLPSMGSHSRTRLKRLSSSSSDSIERVTGRKTRVLQIRKEAADIFISLKWQEETNQQCVFPSLDEFKRRFLPTCCVAMTPGLT